MKKDIFFAAPNSKKLNENFAKQFGGRLNLEKYNREQLEDMRNRLRTKVFQQEGSSGYNDLLTNETYQKNKAMLQLLNTRIKEMLGEDIAKLRNKMVELSEAKKGVRAPKYTKKAKGTLANKDYDGDGKIESPKDEVWGSRAKAAAKAGKPFGKTEKTVEGAWDDMMADVKKRAGPQPSGGAGIKKGHRYGGSAQKVDNDETDSDEKVKKLQKAKRVKEENEPAENGMSYNELLDLVTDAMVREYADENAVPVKDLRVLPTIAEFTEDHVPDMIDSIGFSKGAEVAKRAKAAYENLSDEEFNQFITDINEVFTDKASKRWGINLRDENVDTAIRDLWRLRNQKIDHGKSLTPEQEEEMKSAMDLINSSIGKMEESTGDYSAKKARAGKDIGKPGKQFSKIAKAAGKRYGSKERGEKVAGAVLKKLRAKESASVFSAKVKLVNESLARMISEDEEGKAKAITAASDIVNDFTTWMQRVGQYQTKAIIELADAIRADFGLQQAEAFKQSVAPALAATLETLTQQRENISNAVATLAGEEIPPEEQMGAEPNMGPEEPTMKSAAPDEMNAGDEFAASDAAAGGAETAGREMRESRFVRKLAESHSIIAKLAK